MIANNMQNTMLEYLKPKHMLQFFDSLQLSGKYANKSINNHKANIGVLFNLAIERELITKSPLKEYRKLPEESGKNFPFSPRQKDKLKEKILEEDPDLWLFVKCIYHLFVRPIELLRIKIGDVNLSTKQIIIHSGSSKNKKQLPVAIPKTFLKEIKALKLEKMPEDWYLFGLGLKPGPKKYNRNSVTERHTAILKACGMDDPKYSMYGWKHTGNQDSLKRGVDIFELMRQNRHHSIAQTEAYLNSLGLRPNVGYSSKAPAL
jgi:integrase